MPHLPLACRVPAPDDVATLVDELESRGRRPSCGSRPATWRPSTGRGGQTPCARPQGVRSSCRAGPPSWRLTTTGSGPTAFHLTHDGYRELATFVARQLVPLAG
ncbi:MAG TPA: hypothetical protein VK306_12885 [Acidimicrobiales bacterium]|nr:hypothetical protein [Acidimicrobiales bacterium]